MSVIKRFKDFIRGPNDKLAAIVMGLDNQSKLLDKTLHTLSEGAHHQSRLLEERLDHVVHGIDNQSRVLSDRLDRVIQGIDQVIQGIDHQSSLHNERVASNGGKSIARVSKNAVLLPDYGYTTLPADEFRDLLLRRGAVLLRNAVDPRLLEQINERLEKMFAQYADLPAEKLEHDIASDDEGRRHFRQQIKNGLIYEQAFREVAGLSFFDIIRRNGLWDLASRAFQESEILESAVTNCRRMSAGESLMLFDKPLKFHVDAQHHYVHMLSINFWTPLMACGRDAPGLKVILLGAQETKDYLEFNLIGNEKRSGDIDRMHHFRCEKENMESLSDHNLLKYVWAPEFNKGDILVFTSLTMHATHCLPEMTEPRLSVEVRINLPTVPL